LAIVLSVLLLLAIVLSVLLSSMYLVYDTYITHNLGMIHIHHIYLVCDTHITWLQSVNENWRILFVSIELASAKPNRE
jgi:hypothetical protein